MEKPDSDVAKVLRGFDFKVDHDDDAVGGLLCLVRLAGVELPAEDQMYLAGPFVLLEYGRRPSWLYDLAELERFEIVVEKQPGIVGAAEIVATLWDVERDEWPAELAELYSWAYVKTVARHYGRDPAGLWKALGKKPVADAKVLKSEAYSLLSLMIRRKVVGTMQRAKLEAERQEAYRREWQKKAPAPVRRPPAQPMMF